MSKKCIDTITIEDFNTNKKVVNTTIKNYIDSDSDELIIINKRKINVSIVLIIYL